MLTGSTRAVTLAGVPIGLALLGGMIGAGLDFVIGTQGWWGVGVLIGLMAGATVDGILVEGRGRERVRRPTSPR
jgi:hypothetical protein